MLVALGIAAVAATFLFKAGAIYRWQARTYGYSWLEHPVLIAGARIMGALGLALSLLLSGFH